MDYYYTICSTQYGQPVVPCANPYRRLSSRGTVTLSGDSTDDRSRAITQIRLEIDAKTSDRGDRIRLYSGLGRLFDMGFIKITVFE